MDPTGDALAHILAVGAERHGAGHGQRFQRHEVKWEWVKGHAGHPENERCDVLAREAAGKPTQEDVGYQPEA
jgi:hypothetical protein